MPIGHVLLKPAFDILNFKIKILIDNKGSVIEIPLFAIVILLFVTEFIIVLWQTFMYSQGHEFNKTEPSDYRETKTYINPDGVITGHVINERRFKKK